MNYLVTGGAGFIGSHFVDYLIEKDPHAQILVLDKLTYSGNLQNLDKAMESGRVRFSNGDISDPQIVSSSTRNIDFVINFAAETHVDKSIESSSDFIRSNVLGVEVLLREALNSGVKTFLQVSTDEVYGSLANDSADESFALLPNSPYAASKASADLICRSFHKTYGMDIRISRCTNNYGIRQFPEKLIPLVIQHVRENRGIPVYGNGLNRREWIHVLDHCEGIYLVLHRGRPGEIYNIGSGEEFSNLEIVSKILEVMSASKELITYVPDRPGHDWRYSLNSKKIQLGLSFKCTRSLSETLPELTFQSK